MDEPLSNLDAKLRLEMRSEIRRIHRVLGSATIYVTHDQEEAAFLADRIVVLRDGIVRQVGTPEELYTVAARLDVADFMGYRNVPGDLAPGGTDGQAVEVFDCGFSTCARSVPASVDAAGGKVIVAIRPSDLTPLA